MSSNSNSPPPSRRDLLTVLAAAGVGTLVFQRALADAVAKTPTITDDLVEGAEWIAGIELDDDERKGIVATLNRWTKRFDRLRAVKIANDVPLPLVFQPSAKLPPATRAGIVNLIDGAAIKKPDTDEELAFLPVAKLAPLLRTRAVSSVDLTKLYLKRLKEFDPLLHCVITLTEETALAQAAEADREITAGRYRGPLHGIPWGAKDLIAYPGYPTTWGATPYKEQKLDTTATVAKRLQEAGAVLVAKLSLGALAYGDHWFGGQTRNPWDPKSGSSGSSAGSASAVAAGLVGFALGSETWGSIVSPCRVCGSTGLRPTFGRISRHGCMTLSWSMDKIGPIARSVEDCALILGVLHGRDGLDAAAVDHPFSWPSKRELKSLRVGYFAKRTGDREMKALTDLGVKLIPIELPGKDRAHDLTTILDVEAAAVFDDLTRRGVTEGIEHWIDGFRAGQFVPAVEYIRANRVRAMLMAEMEKVFDKVDLYVDAETTLLARKANRELSSLNSLLTNLTGHPQVVLPTAFEKTPRGELPHSITFTGRLFGEEELLTVANAFQGLTEAHLKRPALR
jgi:Asp-tRNA(Asn)/Glu-tRNA(Gln) amidotransferase A subunit family amidase